MSIEIYYFSGTGNSLYVAKDIAANTGGNLLPIASIVNKHVINIDSEVTGIVFPVYYGELPVIIKRFMEKLDNIKNKYIFAVCTFGGSAGYSLKILKSIIQARGGELSATYRVHMPQNSFSKPWENNIKLYVNWKKKVEQVVRNTNDKAKGEFYKYNVLTPLFMIADYSVNIMRPRYRKAFMKLSNSPPDLDTDELIHRNDMSYSVNEKCNGCGICSMVCPVNNIQIINDRPVWLHHCENCLACYNWCPNRAIEGGVASKGYYYRHPDIKINEMIMREQQTN